MDVTQQDIESLFTEYLPSLDDSLEIRDGQITLAKKVDATMNKGGILLAEAGTGIGKSFAYLIPAIRSAAKDQQIVIVTATITLQHQLAEKDLPRIQTLLGTDIPVAVLKGKTNYLCKSQLQRFIDNNDGRLFEKQEHVNEITKWAHTTNTGDKEELGRFIALSNQQWREISTNEYSCGGKKCTIQAEGCFHRLARNKTKSAGIIITNYNLLAYHLESSNTENSAGLLLPEDSIMVLDEAHRLKDIIRQSLQKTLSHMDAKQIYESLFGASGELAQERKNRAAFEKPAEDLLEKTNLKFKELLESIKKIEAHILLLCEGPISNQRINYSEFTSKDISILDSFHALSIDTQIVIDIMNDILELFDSEELISHTIQKYQQWLHSTQNLAELFSRETGQEGFIRWCELFSKQVSFSIAPLSVRDFLQKSFFEKTNSIICMSATMTYQRNFDDWKSKHGIGQLATSNEIIIDSPFPYQTNVLFLIPKDAPEPSSEDTYIKYLSKHLPEVLDTSKGRALVLCTSHRMVSALSKTLQKQQSNRNWHVLVQDGSESNTALSDRFRNDEHSVLVGTASFWEGFDAPGDTLKMLIITKTPFPNPKDLFIQGESIALQSQGGNTFTEIMMPVAEQKLRQGFGRLMRSHNDSGIILITDSRLLNKGYGDTLLQALPQCSFRFDDINTIKQEIRSFLEK